MRVSIFKFRKGVTHSNRRILRATANANEFSSPISQARFASSTIPLISKCPSPTCCHTAMPTGLNIDYQKPIRGAMPLYHRHIVINTGREDWNSRIEEEQAGDNVAKKLKDMLGPGRQYYNVCAGRHRMYNRLTFRAHQASEQYSSYKWVVCQSRTRQSVQRHSVSRMCDISESS